MPKPALGRPALTLASLATALGLSGCWLLAQEAPSIARLEGHWASEAPEPTTTEFGPAFLFRTFKVQGGRYSLRYELSQDRAGHQRWLAMELAGGLALGGAVVQPPGGQALNLAADRLSLTPHTAAFVAALNKAPTGQCGASAWRLGLTQDLVPTRGCPALGVHVEAGQVSHDAVKLEGGRLFLGWHGPGHQAFPLSLGLPERWGAPLTRLGEAD